MIFVADESVDAGIVVALRQSGHTVDAIAEMSPGVDDAHVLSLANASRALLITADKDFGELVFRQNFAHHGILLLRLYGLPESEKAALAVNIVRTHSDEIQGAFSVLTPDALRVRPKSVL